MASKGHADSIATATTDNGESPVNKPVRATMQKPKQPTVPVKGWKRASLADRESEVKEEGPSAKRGRRSTPKGNNSTGPKSRGNINHAISRHTKYSAKARGNKDQAPSAPGTKESKSPTSRDQKWLLPVLLGSPKGKPQHVTRSRSGSRESSKQKKQESDLLTKFLTEKRVIKGKKSCSKPGAGKTTTKKNVVTKQSKLAKTVKVSVVKGKVYSKEDMTERTSDGKTGTSLVKSVSSETHQEGSSNTEDNVANRESSSLKKKNESKTTAVAKVSESNESITEKVKNAEPLAKSVVVEDTEMQEVGTPKKKMSSLLKKNASPNTTAVAKVSESSESITEKAKNAEPLAKSVVVEDTEIQEVGTPKKKTSSLLKKNASPKNAAIVKVAETGESIKEKAKSAEPLAESVDTEDVEIIVVRKPRRKASSLLKKNATPKITAIVKVAKTGESIKEKAKNAEPLTESVDTEEGVDTQKKVKGLIAARGKQRKQKVKDEPVEAEVATEEGGQDAASPQQLFMCKSCGKIFTKEKKYQRHVAYCEASQHICDRCGKTFKSAAYLKQHFRIHSGEKSFICNICGKGFNNSGNLFTHVKIHDSVRRFTCEHCGKGFNQKVNLRYHQSVAGANCRSKAEAQICDICGRKLSTVGRLIQHKRAHAKVVSAGAELLLTCSYCDKDFKTQTELSRHERIHTDDKPFVCHICPRRFVQKSNLTAHLRVHTGYRPYTCDICGKGFTQGTNLKFHVAKKHDPSTYVFKQKQRGRKKPGAELEPVPIQKIPQTETADPGEVVVIQFFDRTMREEQDHTAVSMVTTEAVVPKLVSEFPGQPTPIEMTSASGSSLIGGISVNLEGSGNSDKTGRTEDEHNYGNVRQQGMVIVQTNIANVGEQSTGQRSIDHLEQSAVAHIDQLGSGNDDQPNGGISEPNIVIASEPSVRAVDQPRSASVVQQVIASVEQPNTICIEPLNSASASVDQQVIASVEQPNTICIEPLNSASASVEQQIIASVEQPNTVCVEPMNSASASVEQQVIASVEQQVIASVEQPNMVRVEPLDSASVEQLDNVLAEQSSIASVEQQVVVSVEQSNIASVEQSSVEQSNMASVEQPSVEQSNMASVEQPSVGVVDQPSIVRVQPDTDNLRKLVEVIFEHEPERERGIPEEVELEVPRLKSPRKISMAVVSEPADSQPLPEEEGVLQGEVTPEAQDDDDAELYAILVKATDESGMENNEMELQQVVSKPKNAELHIEGQLASDAKLVKLRFEDGVYKLVMSEDESIQLSNDNHTSTV